MSVCRSTIEESVCTNFTHYVLLLISFPFPVLSEHELHALEVDMQHLRAQIPKLEETARSAEAALVLRTSQFEQKLALAQRELEKGGNHRQCEETVSELREKIEYLEEVLQMKSAEIEENDDRFIEYVIRFSISIEITSSYIGF